MIEVSVTPEHEWSIVYRLDGVRCTHVVTKDRTVAMKEIVQKMTLDMGLAKGKTFITKRGNEL